MSLEAYKGKKLNEKLREKSYTRGIIGPQSLEISGRIDQRFILAVEEAMEGTLIRYSKRLELLRMADELKIDRFKANLFIAQVQQRFGGTFSEFQKCHNEPKKDSVVCNDKVFMLAAIFIICALVDLALIKFLFG